ncbi:hypothetical protein GIB67_011197 [Kingdonia uniflora]|uniref:Uncharacterized protein n=1 Tax=Kingdonia uniflora TaxID=39325 RepID=A0A7J7M490_9MAGN|nr:hypothetical protein GIB67_011197 [Kingdonia uniflora]
MERDGSKKRVVMAQSLGWLTESSIMPKKHKPIVGVGPSSILQLKAQLYKTQEEAKKAKDLNPDIEFHHAKTKTNALLHDVFSHKNSGVDSRAHRDKLELKAEKDGSNSYAALEKKAELYDKLARGELPDEEEKEKYCVDFFSKSFVQDEAEQPSQISDDSYPTIPLDNRNYDPDLSILPKPLGVGGTVGLANNDEHKRFVREVHEEVNQAREKASAVKSRRQEQVTARRQKLRQAYLKKQLEKLKDATKTES